MLYLPSSWHTSTTSGWPISRSVVIVHANGWWCWWLHCWATRTAIAAVATWKEYVAVTIWMWTWWAWWRACENTWCAYNKTIEKIEHLQMCFLISKIETENNKKKIRKVKGSREVHFFEMVRLSDCLCASCVVARATSHQPRQFNHILYIHITHKNRFRHKNHEPKCM